MKRRNDAGWRQQCLDRWGVYCHACYRTDLRLEIDHIVPRSQGGPSVPENGLVLDVDCHRLKTDHRLLIARWMLHPDQRVWLADNGHVWWDDTGEVLGPRRRIFAGIS